jgi:signal transduction histidine kinase
MVTMQSGQAPGGSSARATRAASLGVAGVVACLAAFSIIAAYTTQTQVDRVRHLEAQHEIYADATTAILAENTAEVEFLLDNSLANSARLGSATIAVIEAVRAIGAQGGAEDAQLSADVLVLHAEKRIASAQLEIAVAAGDRAEARRIDLEVVDPFFVAIHDRLATATGERETQAESALVALRDTAQWLLILAPIAFAIGFALLIGLWRILERYHAATRKTYREIEQLGRLRGEFVATVSHEFRTPLTGIQGFSEMMRDEELTISEMREYAGDINKDAQRLARLISDMLDLDRMESGLMRPSFAAVDLNKVVGDAVSRFRSSEAEHPMTLHLDKRVPTLSGDSERLTQVVTNLVSNAIKYSPSGGAIEIRTAREDGMVVLTVRDHGVGIPTEMLEKIFERYSRIETAGTEGIQGTGLGLPIVRQIVQLYEGKVWATSGSGEGSVFHVQLPLPASATGAPNAGPPRSRVA